MSERISDEILDAKIAEREASKIYMEQMQTPMYLIMKELQQRRAKERETCKWKVRADADYMVDSPHKPDLGFYTENLQQFEFCPFKGCGKRIEVVR